MLFLVLFSLPLFLLQLPPLPTPLLLQLLLLPAACRLLRFA